MATRVVVVRNTQQKETKPLMVDTPTLAQFAASAGAKFRVKAKRIFTEHGLELSTGRQAAQI